MWRWQLQKEEDCIALQEAFSNKWFNGPDERHRKKIEERKRAADKLEDKITRLCEPCPEPAHPRQTP